MGISRDLEDHERMSIRFSDGTSAEANVILGADGIHSNVRNYVVLGDEGNQITGPVRIGFTNTVAYRGLVPVTKLNELGVKIVMNKTPLSWGGDGKVC